MERYKHLTLLHSNDMHGDFLAEKIDDKLVGGISMLSGYVKKTRAEEDNVLYCIAGDMFRGSVIDSEFLGLSTIEIMNMLSPDVVTIGNHETDYGLAHLLFIEKCANFPIINANLHINMNNSRLFNPYKIIEIDGMKILFIGIITEDVIANAKTEGIIGTFINVEDAAKEIGKICNAFNAIDIDLTVLLTHIGFEEDKKLATILEPSWGVDLIIGGHSHTFLDKPAVVNGIPIVQAGTGTDQIGRFECVIDTDNNCLESFNWKAIPINDLNCPKDHKIEEFIFKIKEKTDLKYERIITRFNHKLTHPNRHQQTELGSLISDIGKDAFGVDLMFMTSGAIRKQMVEEILTYQDLMETIPYAASVYQLTIDGKQLKTIMKYIYRDEMFEGDHTEFFQLSSGIEISYNKNTKEITKFKYLYKDINEDQIFKIALLDYPFNNFEYCFGISLYEAQKYQKARVIATNIQDVLDERLSSGYSYDINWKNRQVFED